MSKGIHLGDTAKSELKLIVDKTVEAIDIAIESYSNKNINAPKELEIVEEEIDRLEKGFRENNTKRLNEKKCSAASSVVFLDLISNLERIGDHANNIATVKEKPNHKIHAELC